MIGLDTNVLIRYLTQDDRKQSSLANRLIERNLDEKNLGFVPLVVLVEVIWVLEACYDQGKENLTLVIESMLTIKQLKVERSDLVYLALKRYKSGKADFSDALIAVVSEHAGCEQVVTFDKKATSVGMVQLV